MSDFLTLKMFPLALALIKTKNLHLFAPLVKNTLENSLAIENSKFSCKIKKLAFSDLLPRRSCNQKRDTDDSVECQFMRTSGCFPIFSTCIQTFADIFAYVTTVVKLS